MSVIPIIRQVVLGVTSTFSLIVLATSAHLISQTQQILGITAVFCALGVAIGLISLLSLPVMLVVDIVRPGAFTSMIAVEVAWLSVLWILWVATAGETATLQFPGGCDFVNPLYNGMCQETQAIEAFSFLNFIILLLYSGFLCVIAVMAASRGENVWQSSVKGWFGSGARPAEHPMAHYNATGQAAAVAEVPTTV